MSEYKIHEVEGDTPYVTMHGDFSMDDLLVILEEMHDRFDDNYVSIEDDSAPSPQPRRGQGESK